MRLSAYASSDVYRRHLNPIITALRASGCEVDTWSPDGIWGEAPTEARRHRVAPLVLVAAPTDADRWKDRWVVFVEHGAGQSYSLAGTDVRPQDLRQPGSPGLEQVVLFVVPNPSVGARYAQAYPQAEVAVVGCPALDRHLRSPRRPLATPDETPTASHPRRLVAITAHWPMGAGAIPECMPALPHFYDALPALIDAHSVVGHAHPKSRGRMARLWDELDVAYQPDPDRILERADCLIADNTSLLYEAAACDIPTVVLNGPSYRRDVHHGLRFWSQVPGIQCDDPRGLSHAVEVALADSPPWPDIRSRAARAAYAHLDGHAAQRAADAIHALVIPEGKPPMPPNPEIADRLDEMVGRLYQLGASNALVDTVRKGWDAGDDETKFEYRERLRRMNDHALRQEIVLAMDDLAPEPTTNGSTAPTGSTVRGEMLTLDDEGDA